jgi:hypothetical protein
MGELTIKDDCLAPARFIYLNYSGKDPFGVTKKITEMLGGFFHVSSSGTCEERFNWDKSADPIEFFNKWWVQKSFSNYSRAWFYIKVQGDKTKQTNEGKFVMEIQATLQTKFKSRNPLFFALWWTYSYFFYNKVRRNYIKLCSNLAYTLRDEIKEHYNLRTAGEKKEAS